MAEDKKLVQALTAIDTPTLSNAIEKLKVRNNTSGFCDRSMRCLLPDLGTMCGYAVTVEVKTMDPEDPGDFGPNFIALCRAIEQATGPTVVVFKETSAHPELSAHAGEVLATTFKRLGAVGIVSDSAVRDIPEIHAMGLHCFAPGLVASHANFHIERVQVPVTVCGLRIDPGDLLHGDTNGLLKVPGEGREQLPGLAAGVTAAERKIFEFVKGDSFTLDGLEKMFQH